MIVETRAELKENKKGENERKKQISRERVNQCCTQVVWGNLS